MTEIQKKLFKMQDLGYRDFHSKLMPTIDKETIIGVRVPILRRLAKELFKNGEYMYFLNDLPHKYYEENNLHSLLIMQIKSYDECLAETERFLPYVDNWATCDTLRPKVFKKHLSQLLPEINLWINSGEVYTVRFGIEMLMCHYLDDKFKTEYADLVASVKSEEYYVNMMVAWYFATALAKQYNSILPYIEKDILPIWVHNKTIHKAVESYRITKEQKAYLKTLKR